ncbi:hypothetical protein Droror1_Dr00026837, partial [Drosera rotundifolia]
MAAVNGGNQYNTPSTSLAVDSLPAKTLDTQSILKRQYTFPGVLRACAGAREMGLGEQVHGAAVRFGFVEERHCRNGLVGVSKVAWVLHGRHLASTFEALGLTSLNLTRILGVLLILFVIHLPAQK